MARYIYEYSVPINDSETDLLLDEGVEILSVGLQYSPQWLEEVIVFYAYCEDGAPTSPRRFRVVGTGHRLPEGAAHRGCVSQTSGSMLFVWHLVEVPIPEAVFIPSVRADR